MVMIRPFRPLRYNPALIRDMATVVAPPYDVISPTKRDELYARDPYNIVRLILNREPDPYTAAATLLQQWRHERLLVQDNKPALVYYVENFTLPDGSARERAGIMGVVRLEPFSSGRIRPHERTFARAKEDRMRLLRVCRTNLSPIFGLYAERDDGLDFARTIASRRKPDIDLTDDAGEQHRAWFITDSRAIAAITGGLADAEIVIADGHHRYETALAYAQEMNAGGASDPDAPHNFILMSLTSLGDPGLVILPTHRVLQSVAGVDAAAIQRQLREHFRLTEFARSAHAELLAALQQAQGSFGVALAGSDRSWIATLADASEATRYGSDLGAAVRVLDVAVLDSVLLRGLLNIDCSSAAQGGQLTYTHDAGEAISAVDHGAQAAFIMNPPRIADLLAVCTAGETMPQKSTYFYPKLLTGLVFHPLE